MEKEQEPINNSTEKTVENSEAENHNDLKSDNENKEEASPEDKVEPIVIGVNDKVIKEEKPKPNEENIAPSLLSKVEGDLPSKVREAKENK